MTFSSTESVSKALTATGVTIDSFVTLIEGTKRIVQSVEYDNVSSTQGDLKITFFPGAGGTCAGAANGTTKVPDPLAGKYYLVHGEVNPEGGVTWQIDGAGQIAAGEIGAADGTVEEHVSTEHGSVAHEADTAG